LNSVHQTLYLKYRPQRFADLVGQEVVATTLRNAVREGRFSHAYLFSGIRGTGKTSAARILARAINCERVEDGEPCGECQPCLSIGEQRSLDVIEIDAATNRSIDQIRDLQERAQFLPSQLRTKVYIIDEAHMLTEPAANAFLKTLEEPPEHACFILATTEPQKLAETVLSRCQRFDFRPISAEDIASHLARICTLEGVHATEEAVALVAQAAAGSLRDALSLLDPLLGRAGSDLEVADVQAGLGLSDPQGLIRLAQALAQGQMATAWEELHQLQAAGTEPRQLARALGALARELLWGELGGRPAAFGSTAVGAIPAPPGFWLDLMSAATSAGSALRRADDPWMSLEASLLRLVAGRSATAPEERPAPAPPRRQAGRTMPETMPESEETRTAKPAPVGLDGAGPVAAPVAVDGTVRLEPQAVLPAANRRTDGVGRWNDILAWLGRDNVPVQALLRSGRPASHLDGVLTVEFDQRFAFHLGQMQTAVNRELLQRACQEVLGEQVVVRVVQAQPGPESGARGVAEERGAGGSPALSQAMVVFPGSRVTRLGTSDKR
jgi:DNA polymerase-3 subunit gamma/tau